MPPKKKPAKRKRAARERSPSQLEPLLADVVESTAGLPAPVDGVAVEIRLVLEMVTIRRAASRRPMDNASEWVAAVLAKLVHVNVTTMRELVMATPILNQALYKANHRRLNDLTLCDMMAELVLMIEWPDDMVSSSGSSTP
jgi:hypothetical protein